MEEYPSDAQEIDEEMQANGEEDTLPVVVNFSTSDNPFWTTLPELNDYERHCWSAPDSMTESLFLDFMTEIVDAVTLRDDGHLFRLFQATPELMDELKDLNQKRKTWFGDDRAFSVKVRKVCSNFRNNGHKIFLYPPSESVLIESIAVLVNEDVDPNGEIRKEIRKDIDADIKLYEELEAAEEESNNEKEEDILLEGYPSDEEDIVEEVQANPEKPCYYPSQIEMADILKKRINAIMWHYHKIARLKDVFNDVDFVVYTARYRMLSDQTEKRIRHPDAGVLPKEELKVRKEPNANNCKRMFMYVRSDENDRYFEQLKLAVQQNPQTLFVVIADECHWGITKDKSRKSSAHNLFINEWCKDDSPRNVVVVQISATPFNLLTSNSRLPEVRCVVLCDNTTTSESKYRAGDLLVLGTQPFLENVKQTSKEVELHVAHWSEVELKNFERGMRMKLKSSLYTGDDAKHRYLQVASQKPMTVTTSERDATEFIVEGRHGIVTIKFLESEKRVLSITEDLKATNDPSKAVEFEVKLDFGVDVVAFRCRDKPDHYLAVHDNGLVTLEVAKVERKGGVTIIKSRNNAATVSFEFYLEQYGPTEVSSVGQQYVSLNYYLSTMKCDTMEEQKIREDSFFQRIVDKMKRDKKLKADSSSFKIDALLCAEYCYHVLHASVYDTSDKIRMALAKDVQLTPAKEFDDKLCEFTRELDAKLQESEFIHPEAFKLVKREICNDAKTEFKEDIKEFARMKKQGKANAIDKGSNVLFSFVLCLMYLSQQDFQDFIRSIREAGIIDEIRQNLQQNGGQNLVETWYCNVQGNETSFLVQSLIQSGKGRSGKMKIVRAKSMETANQFFRTLILARRISCLKERFEVIRDYGGIQIEKQLMKSASPFFVKLQPVNCEYKFDCCCKELQLQPGRKKCMNCKHVHKSITKYEDLENLACILILVDKGRMGDTFPHSFDCLDLRLNYDSSREFKEGSPLFLSSVVQELGRMCRYANVRIGESRVQDIPYVLVGRVLYNRLKESLQRSPAMSAIQCTRPDRYMIKSHSTRASSLRWNDYEAHKDSYDHENTQKHCNRILLQAEPQIGKTGTYLCLIKLLRQDILEREDIPSKSVSSFDEGFLYYYKQCDSSEEIKANESMERTEAKNWEYPYWKTIQEAPSLLEKPVAPGKYSFGGCFYTHDCKENPFILMKSVGLQPFKSSRYYLKTDSEHHMRAWHWYHFETCSECGRILQGQEPCLQTILVDLDGKSVSVECSIPASRAPYSHLRKHFSDIGSAEQSLSRGSWAPQENDVPTLPYWIFHPSHRDDPRKCLLNYTHVMKEENRVITCVQVAVVRRRKFQAYKATWGKVLAIFQLPEELPSCEVGPEEGGIGYARLFIQKIASALKLEYIFVIDDNVAMMSEAVFSSCTQTPSNAKVLRDDNGVITMERCSFFKPLSHLQKIAEGKEMPPKFGVHQSTYPLEGNFAKQFPLYLYTGPSKIFAENHHGTGKHHGSYGVLGFLRSVPRTRDSFAKTQVYAVILLNVLSTVKEEVFYRPWPCWEDLRFNDDCDKAGLWVVKCNRYHFLKVQYRDWIQNLSFPSIFQWRKESVLQDRPSSSQLTEDLEERIILEHLRNILKEAGPDKCFKGHLGYDRRDDQVDELPTVRIVDQLEAKDYSEEAETNEIQVLITSYCASNRTTTSMMQLNSRFCSTKERIVFIISTADAIERWPRLTLEAVSTHNGICLFSEMSDRKAQFAILSAADPNRHSLRWILIEACFKQNDPTHDSETAMDVDSGETRFENDGLVTDGEPTGVSSDHWSTDSSCISSSVPESPYKRRKIDLANITNVENYNTSKKASAIQSEVENVLMREVYRESCKIPRNKKKELKSTAHRGPRISTEIKNGGCIPEDIRETTNRKRKLWEEDACLDRGSSSDSAQIEVAVTPDVDEQIEKLKFGASSSDSSQTTSISVYSLQDAATELQNTPTPSQKNMQGKSYDSVSDSTEYQEGTSEVTRAIVDLWKEYTRCKKEGDLTTEQIEARLKQFSIEQLQMEDIKGYTAFLKACSIPSISPHVMQYLIVARKVDLNCTLPRQFDRNHKAASGLVPGMSSLSVAVRRSKSKFIPTFMRRGTEINVRSEDEEGNTALHHCVLSMSKIAFQKLFSLYKPLEWKEMKNVRGENPLNLTKNLLCDSCVKLNSRTKEALQYMLEEMETKSL
ncbi:uncharacterized protein [Montipora capricornis]|uniref:uncharacterized protein n=1 Tax=Montipora capricornis TaxID=246305 RepID=UPI0035F19739